MQGLKPAQLMAWMESNSNYYEPVFCSCQICVLEKRVKVFRHNLLLSAELCSLTCESKQQPWVNISKLRSEWCISSEIMSSISLKPLAELVQLSATAVNQIIAVLLTYNWKQERGVSWGCFYCYNTLHVALVMTTISQLFQIKIFIFPRNACFQPPSCYLEPVTLNTFTFVLFSQEFLGVRIGFLPEMNSCLSAKMMKHIREASCSDSFTSTGHKMFIKPQSGIRTRVPNNLMWWCNQISIIQETCVHHRAGHEARLQWLNSRRADVQLVPCHEARMTRSQ